MHATSRLSSRGRITVPKSVRGALGLEAGDAVVFRIDGNQAVMARARDFLELAGTIDVAAEKRAATWDQVMSQTRSERALRSV